MDLEVGVYWDYSIISPAFLYCNGSFPPLDNANKIGGIISPRSSPPTSKKGGGVRTLPLKIAPKTARRYYKHISLHAVLHGRDVSDYPSSNRGTHRRRRKNKTWGRKEGGGGDGAGGNHHGTSTTGVSCRRRLLRL